MAITWLKKPCPVCSRDFDYIEGGEAPKTCSTFDCVQKYNHNPKKYQSLNEFVDRCRIQAKIQPSKRGGNENMKDSFSTRYARLIDALAFALGFALAWGFVVLLAGL